MGSYVVNEDRLAAIGCRCFAVGLVGGFLAVLNARRSISADLVESDGVDGFVEPSVARTIEPVAVGAAAADRDGRGAVASDVGVAVPETGDDAGLPEDRSSG